MTKIYKIAAVVQFALGCYVVGILASDGVVESERTMTILGAALLFVLSFVFYNMTKPNRWPLSANKIENQKA